MNRYYDSCLNIIRKIEQDGTRMDYLLVDMFMLEEWGYNITLRCKGSDDVGRYY